MYKCSKSDCNDSNGNCCASCDSLQECREKGWACINLREYGGANNCPLAECILNKNTLMTYLTNKKLNYIKGSEILGILDEIIEDIQSIH